MTPQWIKTSKLRKPCRSLNCVPSVVLLEDRTVPATFYVDPSLAPSLDGATSTFNAGYPNTQTGLIYGSSLAFWNANKATVNVFSDLRVALDVSEANPGADTIIMSHGQIPLANPGVLGDINSIPVTQSLTLVGSGTGATVISPTNDTEFDLFPDEFTSIFRISGGTFTASNFRFDGGTNLIGTAFIVRDGATGVFDNVGISNTIFTPAGQSSGAAIVGFKAASLTVSNSDISNYGRNGVLFQTTNGSVINTKITGRGAGNLAQNGIEADGSNVFITGNLITGNNGTVTPTDVSSGIIALNVGTNAVVSNLVVIGNTITNNTVGLNLGTAPDDASTITANYNNILNNEVGAFGVNATTQIIAPNNWWGDASGPFNTSGTASFDNPTGLGNPAQNDTKVVFRPFLTNQTPRVATLNTSSSAAGVTSYLTQISTVGVAIVPAGPSLLTTPASSISYNVTFAKPVTGFDSTDVLTSGTIGGSKTVSVTGSGANYVVTVSGLLGQGTLSINVPVQAALDFVDGYLTAASNTSTVTVAIPSISATINPVGPALLTTATSSVQYTVNFSSAVTGFDAADVLVGGTIGGTKAVSISGSGTTYTVTVSGLTGNGTITVQVPSDSVVDPVSGLGTSTNVSTITVAVPTISATINPAGAALFTTPTSSVQYTVNFSSAVTGFDAADVVVGGTIGGTKSVSVSGSGTTYTVTVSGLTGNGTLTLQIPQASTVDPVLILGSATNTSTITVAVPTISASINPVGPALLTTATSSVQYTVNFSTAVTGFDAADVIVGGTISGSKTVAISGSGTTYTVTVNGLTGNGTITLQVPLASTVDPSLILGVASNTATITVAVPAPIPVTAALNPISPSVITSTPTSIQYAVKFSAPVTGFDSSDVVVGGTMGGTKTTTITGSGTDYVVTVTGMTGNGTLTVQLPAGAVVDPNTTLGSASNISTVTVNVPAIVKLFAVGADSGSLPTVQVFGANGAVKFQFLAFESTFTGGVHVATADMNSDGTDDIIVAAGNGGAARIRVLSGTDGTQLANFYAYEQSFRGGASVAAGDLYGTGKPVIVTGAGNGGGPRVGVYDLNGNSLQSYFAYAPTFLGGISVAVGDTNSDGKLEIVTGAGAGGGPHVRSFNGTTGAGIANFFAYDSTYTGGVNVAAGNVGTNGASAIVVAAGSSGQGNTVRTFTGAGTQSSSFTAYESSFNGGIRVGVKNLAGTGTASILTAPGPLGGSRIQAFTNGVSILNTLAFDQSGRFGYFIG